MNSTMNSSEEILLDINKLVLSMDIRIAIVKWISLLRQVCYLVFWKFWGKEQGARDICLNYTKIL